MASAMAGAAFLSVDPNGENGGGGDGGGGDPGLAITGEFSQVDEYGESGFSSVWLPAGIYTVQISVANFVSSSWGSHHFHLDAASGSGAFFYNESNVSLYGISGGSVLDFYLADPGVSPNPQVASAALNLSQADTVILMGVFPMFGDHANFNITFTPT